MRIIFLFVLCSSCAAGTAQTKYSDSLKNLLIHEGATIARFDLINKIEEDDVNNGANIDANLCLQMVQLAQNLKNDSLIAIGYNMAASFNARKGNYPTALEYLFKAIPLAEKARDYRRLCSIYFDISLVYIIIKDLKESFYYNAKGGEYLPKVPSPKHDFMTAQYNRNMIRYYLLVNKPAEALPYAQLLELEGISLKAPVVRLPSLFLTGATYDKLDKNELAATYFKKAVDLADSLSSLGLIWTNDKYYIPFLIKMGRVDEAKRRAGKLVKLGKANNNWDVTLTGSSFLRNIFDKANIRDSAYFYSMTEMAMKDSLFSENNLNKVQALAFNEKLHNLEEQRNLEINEKKKEQSFLFIGVGLSLALLTILFITQLRKRRKEMDNKLTNQRERISRELHDNLGSQLSYIIGNIDGLIDADGHISREEELKKLSHVSEASKVIVNDLRETIWVIKKESIKLEELSDKLKSHLHKQISICQGMEVEIIEHIEKEYCFLPTVSLNTYRIFQEAISNIIKHSNASKIVLQIISDRAYDYFISIADNGSGFDTQIHREGHYGLQHMTQRAIETGATLSIVSEPGKGAKITLARLS